MRDLLVTARDLEFDVFNSLDLLENKSFLRLMKSHSLILASMNPTRVYVEN